MIRLRNRKQDEADEESQISLWFPEPRSNGKEVGPTIEVSPPSGRRIALFTATALVLGATGSWWITHVVDSRRAASVLERETREAHDAGFGVGFDRGRSEGYEAGYDQGYETGQSDVGAAVRDAYREGFAEGKQEGITEGRRSGYDAGWSQGYDDGWLDGCVSTFDDLASSRIYDEAGYWYLDRSQCLA